MQPDIETVAPNHPFDCVLGAWRAHEPELRAFLRRRAKDPETAEDLLHDVFVRAMQAGRGFCRLDDPRAWLFRVARNAWIDSGRRRRAEAPLQPELPERAPDDEPLRELHRCLEANLQRLDGPDREILQACDLEGMRQADFARSHGLSLPAVKSRVVRARARLRALLVQNCNVMFDDQGNVCCHAAEPMVPGAGGPGA